MGQYKNHAQLLKLVIISLIFGIFIVLFSFFSSKQLYNASIDAEKKQQQSFCLRLLIQEKQLKKQQRKFNRTDFNAYFDSKATFINAKVPFQKKTYFPISWPIYNKTIPIVGVSLVITSSGIRPKIMLKTLESFFTFNTYPLKKIVAIYDGQRYPQLEQIIETYNNITWIITNIKVGQLQAADQALRHIQTEFYFHAQDDFQYKRYGFIQYSLQGLLLDPKATGLILSNYQNTIKKNQIGAFFVPRYNPDGMSRHYYAFSFNPSVKRVSIYRSLDGGYSGACLNISFQIGAGKCEPFISFVYKIKGYHQLYAAFEFIFHNGNVLRGGDRRFSGTGQNLPQDYYKIIQKIQNSQENYISNQQQRQKYNYLIPKDILLQKIIRLKNIVLQQQKKQKQLADLKKEYFQKLEKIQQLIQKNYNQTIQNDSIQQQNGNLNQHIIEFIIIQIALFTFMILCFLKIIQIKKNQNKLNILSNQKNNTLQVNREDVE